MIKIRQNASVYVKYLALLISLVASGFAIADAPLQATFAGRDGCVRCHAEQTELWSGSHHDLAMQHADADTVLGDFNNASLTHFGVTSSFYMKNGKFMVRTQGEDGKYTEYPVKYTFGAEPLQQYLVEFPGGRMQALSMAWDARPRAQGGQRWFHLYPDEEITPDDELHWTKRGQNWNSMCAECHSTHLEKNYDPINDTFDTRWSEIDVSCEACHGPASQHVLWADKKPGWKSLDNNKGLSISLDERSNVRWTIDPESGNAKRSEARQSSREIEMCARCHARRSPISDGYVHGEPLLDHYIPSLLDEGMYHADGQIDDEVYVYGSFLQSKMFHEGVTCSDCHEPHSLALRLPGNGVCLQCHAAKKYDAESHHFHKPGSTGASCAECHMPPKKYMVIDPRHDHSMRIPRPDQSVKFDTPNACNNCHTDESAEWAVEQLKSWYGHTPRGFQRYAETLHDARDGDPRTGKPLLELIKTIETPDIARATALPLIAPYLNAQNIDILTLGLWHEDPNVRLATTGVLEQLPVDLRGRLAFPLLKDDVRAVRAAAARALAAIPAGDLPADEQALLDRGLQDYVTSQLAMAERPEAQTNLGSFYAVQGKTEQAVAAFRAAIALAPDYVPAYVNLADMYRSQGDEKQTEQVLRQALDAVPENATVYYALGLSLVRQKRMEVALEALRGAAMSGQDNPLYVNTYAIALNSAGKAQQAIMVLQGAHKMHPDNIDILNTLVAFHRDSGNLDAARNYAEKLQSLTRRP